MRNGKGVYNLYLTRRYVNGGVNREEKQNAMRGRECGWDEGGGRRRRIAAGGAGEGDACISRMGVHVGRPVL